MDASIFMVIRSGPIRRNCLQHLAFGLYRSAQSAAAVIQDDPKQASRAGTESGTTDPAPATQETVPNDRLQVQAGTTQSPNREASSTLSNGSPSVETAPLAADAWGEMLRGAPVHSGPDVSSAILGYVAAGKNTSS